MAKVSYFMARSLTGRAPKGRGITVTPATVELAHDVTLPKGTKLKGFTLTGPEGRLEEWRERTFLATDARDLLTSSKDGPTKILVSGLSEVCVVIGDETKLLEKAPDVREELRRFFGLFAGVTGRVVRVTLSDAPQLAPMRSEGGVIDVIIGPSPAGAAGYRRSNQLCGIPLDQRGYFVYHRDAAAGRGIILRDENDVAFAQVVENVIYLLVPVHSVEALRLLDTKRGPGLLERAFVPAWNALVAPTKEQAPPRRRLSTAEAMELFTRETLDMQERVNHALLKDKKERVEKTLAAYLEALRDLETIRMFADTASKRTEADAAQVVDDWKRLLAHPLVAGIEAMDGFMHLRTRALTLEHEGRRYRLGSYVIRFSPHDGVSIWSKTPTHPERIPHPHISSDGTICFGNVTRVIHEDVVALRFGSAAETVLRWLTEGYDPARADTKIEQWPLARRKAA